MQPEAAVRMRSAYTASSKSRAVLAVDRHQRQRAQIDAPARLGRIDTLVPECVRLAQRRGRRTPPADRSARSPPRWPSPPAAPDPGAARRAPRPAGRRSDSARCRAITQSPARASGSLRRASSAAAVGGRRATMASLAALDLDRAQKCLHAALEHSSTDPTSGPLPASRASTRTRSPCISRASAGGGRNTDFLSPIGAHESIAGAMGAERALGAVRPACVPRRDLPPRRERAAAAWRRSGVARHACDCVRVPARARACAPRRSSALTRYVLRLSIDSPRPLRTLRRPTQCPGGGIGRRTSFRY